MPAFATDGGGQVLFGISFFSLSIHNNEHRLTSIEHSTTLSELHLYIFSLRETLNSTHDTLLG